MPVPSVEDPRFTYGLVSDVGAVLADHGFPPVTSAADHVALSAALNRFIFGAPR